MPFFGEQLRTARHFRNLSLSELGELVAVTRQYLHRVETSGEVPTIVLRSALADALRMPLSFFGREPQVRFGDADCHFRKRRTTSVAARDNALAVGRLFAEFVDVLDKRVKLPQLDLPPQQASSRVEIELIAEDCRERWKLGLDAPIKNVCRTLEHAGIVVAAFPDVTDRVDAFSWSGRRPIIVKNTIKDCPCRSRFDLAHECGHLILHTGMVTGDVETESQADAFASALLLPRAAFVREFPRSRTANWQLLFAMKKRWLVSVAAIVRRAYDLQLIDAAEYRRAFIYLRKKGWARGEPHEPADEVPELVRLSVARLTSAPTDGIDALLARLGWSSELLEAVTGVTVDRTISPPPNVVPFSRARR